MIGGSDCGSGGRGKREEGRGKREEGRGKREGGRGKGEGGRGKGEGTGHLTRTGKLCIHLDIETTCGHLYIYC